MNRWIATLCVWSVSIAGAQASPLVYRGNNPAITPTAPSFNQSGIDSRAALTRPKEKVSTGTRLTDAELIRQSVLNGLSASYLSTLTAAGSTNGTLNFGDGSYATYTTASGIRTVTFHNLDGTTTTISFPITP